MDIDEKVFYVCFVLCVVSFSLGFTQLEPRTRFAIVMNVALIVWMIVSSLTVHKKKVLDKKAKEKQEALEKFVKWLKEHEDEQTN